MTADVFCDPAEELLEGVPSARFWPFVRPMDGVASNSFLVSVGSLYLVIDPGADLIQTRQIFSLLEQKRGTITQPVLLMLTHCHRDHSLAITHWQENDLPFRVLAHQIGAEAFRSGNTEATLAFLYGEKAPVLDVSIPLSFSSPRGCSDTCSLSGSMALELIMAPMTLPSGMEVKRQLLRLNDDVCIEIYHSPGHSPDSLCFQIGPLLFTGDILFADKPGVAGIPGWSRSCLLNSLDMLEWLIQTRNISRVCPGHGPVVPAEDVLGLILSAKKNAVRLKKLIRLDSDRVTFLRSCARIFVHEAGLLLSVLGGRIYLLSDRLTALEESGLAQTLIQEISLESMEKFIRDFQLFSESPPENTLRMGLPLKAVNIVGRIRRVFQKSSLPEGIAEILLQRVEWLLRDYISIATGFDLRDSLVDVNIRDVFQQAVATFQPYSWSIEDGGRAAENSKTFAVFLARNMDFRIQLPILDISDDLPLASLQAKTDPLRLKLLFVDVLEQLAVKKPSAVTVTFEKRKDHLMMAFSVENGADDLLARHKTAYYTAMMRLLGGDFVCAAEGRMYHARFFMTAAEAENP